MRRKNRQLIFRLLFPTNQYSRAELGRRTGLSRVAVSDVVGRMLEEGLLRETGQAPSGGKGKRGTLLSIDIDRLRIISIDLTQEHLLHGAVTNLLGQPLRHAEVTLNTGSFVSVDVIIELIEKMLGMSDGEVIGIRSPPRRGRQRRGPLLHDARLEQSRPVHANRRTFRT